MVLPSTQNAALLIIFKILGLFSQFRSLNRCRYSIIIFQNGTYNFVIGLITEYNILCSKALGLRLMSCCEITSRTVNFLSDTLDEQLQ